MTTKDTKTTKNRLESPLDWSNREGVREAQPLIHKKPGGAKTGRLIDFNVTKRRDRIKRFVLGVLRVLRGVFLPLKDRKSQSS